MFVYFRFIPLLIMLVAINACTSSTKLGIGGITENFDSLYTNEYQLLWASLNNIKDDLEANPTVDKMTAFFRLLDVGVNNAEYKEYIHDLFENFTVNKPKILSLALSESNPTMIKKYKDIVNYPIFMEKKEIRAKVKDSCSPSSCQKLYEILDLK